MDADRKFYVVWGIVLILLGLAAAMAFEGYFPEGVLLFFVGTGISLIFFSEGDNTKFYGGIAFVLLGALLYSALTKISMVLTVIVVVIIVGALVVHHGLRGEKR